MSSDDNYLHDYKKFKQNRNNNISNSFSKNYSETLDSSDLRNKITSNKINKRPYRNTNNSNNDNNNVRDMEWEKRKNDNIELDWQRKKKEEIEWMKREKKPEEKIIEKSSDFELYKEYVQWDFINNHLYEMGEKLMNIAGRGKQEFTNTLQRWFIFINEDFNEVPKYEYYPILPKIKLSHAAAQFLRDAFLEKQFVTEDDADHIVEKMLRAIDRAHSKVVPHDQMEEPLHIEYDSERHVIVVNKFQSPEVPRVDLLVSKGGVIASARMLLRYESFGNGSYQWGDPKEVHRVLHDQFQVRYEGFASPVNSRFLEYDDGTFFCSLFPEVDRPFGSLGNFFHVKWADHPGSGWSVNPPFLNDLMKKVADLIVDVLDNGHNSYFFCTFPCWDDDPGWQTLNNSRHLCKRFDLRAHHFVVQDAYGNKFEPNMAMNLFVMGELPRGTARLTELGNKLIFNHTEALPDQCPW